MRGSPPGGPRPTATSDLTPGEEVLNYDHGTDEIYATFELTNLFTLVRVNRKSPEVTGNF